MHKPNTYRLIWVAAVALAFVPLPFLLKTDDMFTLLDAVAVSVGTGVLVAYLRGAWGWLSAPRTTAGHLLVLGIVCTWFAAVGRLGWLWFWRLSDRPAELMDHWFVALTIHFFIIGGALHLVANRAIDNQIPPSGWATLVATISFGVALGFGLIIWTA